MSYGNLINRVMENSNNAVSPSVGVGCTVIMYSDRIAGTIVRIIYKGKKTKILIVQADNAIRTDSNSMSDSQSYRYEPDPSGRIYYFKQNRVGRWTEASISADRRKFNFVSGGAKLLIGHRDHYYDYSF